LRAQNLARSLLSLIAIVSMCEWCEAEESERIIRIDAAIAKATRYFIDKQSSDGAWRSETYGALRNGPALTSYVLSGLFFMPQGAEPALKSYRDGVAYLMDMVNEDGTIDTGPHGINYLVYTAASASRVVVLENRSAENLAAQGAWLAHLRQHHLGSALGWIPKDPEFGGWGFSLDIPRKPPPGTAKSPMVKSNLTATLFGIGALRSARVPPDDPIWADVLMFVKKCQNFSEDSAQSDPDHDDGGFYFAPDDPLENKAGEAGTDRHGRARFYSYGSMTADGVRALLQCGLPPGHPRVQAALNWLERNFTAKEHPGTFDEGREVLRGATYFYYLWSVSHAFSRLAIVEVETKHGHVKWAEAMADELLARQRDDGTWLNPYTDAKEDDPLVTTPWAASALAISRQVIAAPSALSRTDFPTLP
jgi:hypothetical protein